MKYVYVILIIISLTSAQLEILNIIDDENSDVNINDHVDHSIPRISQFIINNHLDPLDLPQIEKRLWMKLSNTTISNEIEPIIYRADLILHSGILKHLSDLKRYGDAIISYKDKVLKLDVGFEFELLQGKYNFTLNLVFFNLKGLVLASTTNVRAKTIITFNTTNYTLSLDKFELQVPGKITVVVEYDSGSVDWLNTFIANLVTPFFQNTIINVVEKEVTSVIRTWFDEINHRIAKNKITNVESIVHEIGMLIS